jgi:hypothetical protein
MDTVIDLRTIQLPSELLVGGQDLAPQVLGFVDLTVPAWANLSYLSKKQGYGFATTNVVPAGSLMNFDWNDPESLLGFGIAAHGASPHYPWNALRKMRMLLRGRQAGYEVTSSLQLARTRPDFVLDAITEAERDVEKGGGLIRWGDFPYGGAVYRTDGVNEVMLGFSVWEQDEDNRVSGATADYLLELALDWTSSRLPR